MTQLYWLDQIQESERLFVGEKAFVLSQLIKLGCPVIPGFVISASTLQNFLTIKRELQPLLADLLALSLKVDIDNYQDLQNLAQQNYQEIIAASLPSQWLSTIVSATQQLDSLTLILRSSISLSNSVESELTKLALSQVVGFPQTSQICSCRSEALSLALKQIWAKLFEARSLFYWNKVGIDIEKINWSILVQSINNAIASGTIKIQDNQILIHATWGLGHSVVKGEVLPDSYEIEKSTGTLKFCQLGNKTRAYKLKEEEENNSNNTNYLEAYLLTEEEQAQYILNQSFLKKLIELTQNVIAQQENINYLEWTLIKNKKNSEPQFYLTQANFENSTDIPVKRLFKISEPKKVNSQGSKSLMANTQLLLKGLSASPGQAQALVQVISGLGQHLQKIPPGKILVTKNIAPDWLPLLKKSAGIVTEKGGMTSHGAIIARELGIPAIVGATDATKLLTTGESVLLNADSGELYLLQGEQGRNGKINKQEQFPLTKEQSPIINYPLATQLLVNLSQPSSISKAITLPVNGVGLIRSELMLMEMLSSQPLEEWIKEKQKIVLVENLTQLIGQFATAFAQQPVFYRSLDLRYFKFPIQLNRGLGETTSLPQEQSPELGINSIEKQQNIYNYQLNPILFELELEAIAKVYSSGYKNVNLLLPFVRSVEEFTFYYRQVKEIGLTEQPNFQLWIMAEVPSVLFLLPEYVQAGVQGIAIGTNDLTQLMLGIDREQIDITTNLNAKHPVMLKVIQQLIEMAIEEGIPCSICGQAPVQYPDLIDKLVSWGITSISVEPEAVQKTYLAIARAEKRLILEAARHR